MKPSRAGGCLKGARHCPQCNHFFKTEGPRPEPEGNGCGMGRRGPLWGSRSVFLLSEDASIKPSSCLRSSCSVLASLALRSRFYKNMFSRVNSAQLTFLLSHLNSYFRSSRSFCFHTLAARTIFSEYRRGEERAALPS